METEADRAAVVAKKAEDTAAIAAAAARKAIRCYRNRALAGFLVLTLGVGFAVNESNTARDRIAASANAVLAATCKHQDEGFAGVARIFTEAEALSAKYNAQQTAANKRVSAKFYADALKNLAPIKCSTLRVTQ